MVDFRPPSLAAHDVWQVLSLSIGGASERL